VRAFDARAITLLLVFFAVCGVVVALRRGAWIDEFWSLWLAQRDLSFADAMRERWLADFHPPLYSIVQWVAGAWLDDSLPARRLLNFVPLAWAAGFAAVAAKRYPQQAPVLWAYAIAALSLSGTFLYFSEMRSYFAQLCLVFVVAGAVVAIAETRDDLDWRRDRAFALMSMATIALALNVHYFLTLLTGLLVGCLVLSCWLDGKRRWAGALVASVVAGAVPLLAFFREHVKFLGHESETFWVSGSIYDAMRIVARAALDAAQGNAVVAIVAALAVLATLAARFTRRRPSDSTAIFDADFRSSLEITARRRRTALLLVVALGLFAAVLLAAHARRPIIFPRYLLAFQVAVLSVVACLAAQALARSRVLLSVAVAAAVATLALQTFKAQGEGRWEASARIVSELHAACPASPVYVSRVPGQWQSVNGGAVAAWGYEWMARRHGFEVTYIDWRKGLPIARGECPTVLWIEHVNWNRLPKNATPEAALRFLGVDASKIDLVDARFVPAETGFVMTLPAAAEASEPGPNARPDASPARATLLVS
jgi:hypothetical protein